MAELSGDDPRLVFAGLVEALMAAPLATEAVVGEVWKVRRIYVMQRANVLRQVELIDGEFVSERVNQNRLRLARERRSAMTRLDFIERAIEACEKEKQRLIAAYVH